jgi:hypothetical protein
MTDPTEILGILESAVQRRSTGSWQQVGMYTEHVARAAEVIRALVLELEEAGARKKKCSIAPWCVYEDGHTGSCSLIRARIIEVQPLTLGIATDALNLADEFIDDIPDEGERKRKVQVEIDRALEELARTQGFQHTRIYDDSGKALHGEG